MRNIKHLLSVALITLSMATRAQSVTDASEYYSSFISDLSIKGETAAGYDVLYRCYEMYSSILKNGKPDDQEKAKNGLKKLHPYIQNGAYYFTSKNSKDKTEKFIEAFIDITIDERMKDMNLQLESDYPTFAYIAASSNYNGENFAKAIGYFNAYINSGESTHRQDCYYFMAKSFLYLGDKENSKKTLTEGLELYPDNLNMLSSIINMLGESKEDDAALQKYVTRAYAQRPDDEGLINIQASLFERSQKFREAAELYGKLRSIKPNNKEAARHLAVNNYNAGVVCAKQAKETDKKKIAAQHKQEALGYLSVAATVLNEVLIDDPLAINYAYALAKAYAYMGNDEQFKSTNQKITALGQKPVSDNDDIDLIAVNSEIIQRPTSTQKPTVPKKLNDIIVDSNNTDASKSDVDINIPEYEPTNTNTFAVIIANEKYTSVAAVPNAENDGNTFATYCNKVLGLPIENIRKHTNVTYAGFFNAINDIKAIVNAKQGQCKVIFYYAGHGVPIKIDDNVVAYLLPTDSDGKNSRFCFPLNDLYDEFSGMNAECVTMFLDACFSGATREKKMIMSARAVAIATDDNPVDGKMVVFSAATGAQTAFAYDEKKHGMFTYFLLKILQESNGEASYAEIANYVKEKVSVQARLTNRVDQTPTVTPGNGFEDDWTELRLK